MWLSTFLRQQRPLRVRGGATYGRRVDRIASGIVLTAILNCFPGEVRAYVSAVPVVQAVAVGDSHSQEKRVQASPSMASGQFVQVYRERGGDGDMGCEYVGSTGANSGRNNPLNGTPRRGSSLLLEPSIDVARSGGTSERLGYSTDRQGSAFPIVTESHGDFQLSGRIGATDVLDTTKNQGALTQSELFLACGQLLLGDLQIPGADDKGRQCQQLSDYLPEIFRQPPFVLVVIYGFLVTFLGCFFIRQFACRLFTQRRWGCWSYFIGTGELCGFLGMLTHGYWVLYG